MITSKIFDLLKTFTPDDINEFGEFIRSPFFNKERIQIKFYKIIKRYYPDFTKKSFSKEKVFAKLYPAKKYNDGVMRNILSTANFLAGKFLAHSKFSFEISSQMCLLAELNNRKAEKQFEKLFLVVENTLVNTPVKDGDLYYNLYLLQSEKRKFERGLKSKLNTNEESLIDISDLLTVSFIINTLKIYIDTSSTNKYMFHFERNTELMYGIERHIEHNHNLYKDNTMLLYYYNIYLLIRTKEVKYYYKLCDLYGNKYNEIKDFDLKNLFTILANFCYSMINKGELKFINEQFELYRQNLEFKLYKAVHGFMSHIFYMNVVFIGLECDEFIWVNSFIEKYKSELDEHNRENTYNFCRAFLEFRNKNYPASLRLASLVKTDDLSYKHQLKSFYLKVYYEMNETEAFYSHIDSYRHFISSDKRLNETIRNNIGSYIYYCKKLYNIKQVNYNIDEDIALLKNEIIKNESIINKKWLLDKASEIQQFR